MCRICGLTEKALKQYWRSDITSNPKQCYLVWRRAGADAIVPECLSYLMGTTNQKEKEMIERRMKLINEKD